MRALFALLLLVALFLGATTWRSGQTRARQKQREQEFGLPLPAAGHSAQWSLLVLGSISGAAPIPGAQALDAVPLAEPVWTDPGEQAPPWPDSPRYAPDYIYQVQGGDVLGTICKRHYGSAGKTLVQAVAHYNGLASPNAIRAGNSILLPDRALLDQ